MFGYIDVNKTNKRSPELWQIPPETPCIASVERNNMNMENWYYDNDRETSLLGENLFSSQVQETYPCRGLGRPLGF